MSVMAVTRSMRGSYLSEFCWNAQQVAGMATSCRRNRHLRTRLPRMVRQNGFQKRYRFPCPPRFARLPNRAQNWSECRGCAAIETDGPPAIFQNGSSRRADSGCSHDSKVLCFGRVDVVAVNFIGVLLARPAAVPALACSRCCAGQSKESGPVRRYAVFRRGMPVCNTGGSGRGYSGEHCSWHGFHASGRRHPADYAAAQQSAGNGPDSARRSEQGWKRGHQESDRCRANFQDRSVNSKGWNGGNEGSGHDGRSSSFSRTLRKALVGRRVWARGSRLLL